MKQILIIDDNEDLCFTLDTILSDAGYVVRSVRCPKEAYELFHDESFDLILCDLTMPLSFDDEDFSDFPFSAEVGIRTILELRWLFPHIPVIPMTSSLAEVRAAARERLDCAELLSKPISQEILLRTVERSFNRASPALQ